MTTQTQRDCLDEALDNLNERMKGYSQYDIVTTPRGSMSLCRRESYGKGKVMVYLGNDVERAAQDLALLEEWESNR